MYGQVAQRALLIGLVSVAGALPVFASSSVRTAGASDSGRTELQGQANCPAITDFANSEALFNAFDAPTDSVWDAIQEALKAWHTTHFLAKSKTQARSNRPIVSIENDRSTPFQQSARSSTIGRTCFDERRLGYRDTRVAFYFAARRSPGKKKGTDLEMRWLVQAKGSSSRTWRASTSEAGSLPTDLMQLIKQQLTSGKRSP